MCVAPPDIGNILPKEDGQLDLVELAVTPWPCPNLAISRPVGRERLTVDLRGYGPKLRALAEGTQTSTAAIVRNAIRDLVDQSRRNTPARISREGHSASPTVKVTLRLSSEHARSLAARARDAEVAQGAYVAALLDDAPPPPVASDHSVAVEALMKSTDHLAAMSTDLNAFLRMVGRVPSDKLNPLRGRLHSLVQDVRSHLVSSAALMSELQPKRRPRR